MKIQEYRKMDKIELGKKLNLLKIELWKAKVEDKRIGAAPSMEDNPKRVSQVRKGIPQSSCGSRRKIGPTH